MKAYPLELRERIVAFVRKGGAKTEAAERFSVSLSTVYRCLAAEKGGKLAPETSWGSWRKLDPREVMSEVRRRPDATLGELAQALGVHLTAVRHRLRKMKVALKKTRAVL